MDIKELINRIEQTNKELLEVMNEKNSNSILNAINANLKSIYIIKKENNLI